MPSAVTQACVPVTRASYDHFTGHWNKSSTKFMLKSHTISQNKSDTKYQKMSHDFSELSIFYWVVFIPVLGLMQPSSQQKL